MPIFSRITESLFPERAAQRAAQEQASAMRAKLYEARMRRLDTKQRAEEAVNTMLMREIAQLSAPESGTQRGTLEESYQYLGIPFQQEWAGLTLDEAWRRGLPDLQLAFQYDTTTVANNDSLRNEILKVSRILYSAHPHAKAVIDTAKSFVVGPHAWQVEPMPKVQEDESGSAVKPVSEAEFVANRIPPVAKIVSPEVLLRTDEDDPRERKPRVDYKRLHKIRSAFDRWQKRGRMHPQQDWVEFWDEAWMRTRRDGETFIHLGHDRSDGRLSPRFLEPEDIIHPSGGGATYNPGIFDPDQNGIRVDEQDPQTVTGYWWRPSWKIGQKPQLLEAQDVIHIKMGVDSGARRGVPALFCVRHFLRHFDTWIQQSLKHQKIQSMVAILRQWDKATPDVVNTFSSGNAFRSREMTTPAGNNFTYQTQQLLPFVDAPRGMTMQPFVPAGNYGDSEILARRVLLAVAAGENMSEAMVTQDGSNANYSSTRITQIPPFRGFESEQGKWVGRVELVYQRWLATEAVLHRQEPIYDECQLDCHVTPNPLPPFEMEMIFGMVTSLYGSGLISKTTSHEMLGLDSHKETERLDKERGEMQAEQANAQAALQGQGFNPSDDEEEPELEDDDEEESANRGEAVA